MGSAPAGWAVAGRGVCGAGVVAAEPDVAGGGGGRLGKDGCMTAGWEGGTGVAATGGGGVGCACGGGAGRYFDSGCCPID